MSTKSVWLASAIVVALIPTMATVAPQALSVLAAAGSIVVREGLRSRWEHL